MTTPPNVEAEIGKTADKPFCKFCAMGVFGHLQHIREDCQLHGQSRRGTASSEPAASAPYAAGDAQSHTAGAAAERGESARNSKSEATLTSSSFKSEKIRKACRESYKGEWEDVSIILLKETRKVFARENAPSGGTCIALSAPKRKQRGGKAVWPRDGRAHHRDRPGPTRLERDVPTHADAARKRR